MCANLPFSPELRQVGSTRGNTHEPTLRPVGLGPRAPVPDPLRGVRRRGQARRPDPPLPGLCREAHLHVHAGRSRVADPGAGMWAYRDLLPLADPAHVVTLGEGDTPLGPA